MTLSLSYNLLLVLLLLEHGHVSLVAPTWVMFFSLAHTRSSDRSDRQTEFVLARRVVEGEGGGHEQEYLKHGSVSNKSAYNPNDIINL